MAVGKTPSSTSATKAPPPGSRGGPSWIQASGRTQTAPMARSTVDSPTGSTGGRRRIITELVA